MTFPRIGAVLAFGFALALAALGTPQPRAEAQTPQPAVTPTGTPLPPLPPPPSATGAAGATATPTATVTPETIVPQASDTPVPAVASPAPATTSSASAPATPVVPASALPVPRPPTNGYRTVPELMNDPRVLDMMPRPIVELTLFDWLKGTWRSHTVAQLPVRGTRDLGTNTYVFAPVLKGRWIFGATGRADDYFYLTYDPFARRYALLRVQGDPSYGVWYSYDGWHGNRIVFLSSVSSVIGRPFVRRLTIDHTDAFTFDIVDEEQKLDGTWLTDDTTVMVKESK